MKEYEHRRLVCEHECKVGEKYVLPQAQAFGLSWSMPMDQNGPLQCTEEDPQGATGQRSPLDPTDKQTVDKGEVVARVEALKLVSGSGMHKCPRAG